MRIDLLVIHPDPSRRIKRLRGLGKADAATETEFWTRLGYTVEPA